MRTRLIKWSSIVGASLIAAMFVNSPPSVDGGPWPGTSRSSPLANWSPSWSAFVITAVVAFIFLSAAVTLLEFWLRGREKS